MMIGFRKYISEKIKLPDSGAKLGFDRKDMPQVDKKHHQDFFSFLKGKGVSVKKTTIDPNKLKPSQSQFYTSKIEGMVDSIQKGTHNLKPIIVSKDNYVIDGHHTWIAYMNLDREMSVAQVNAPAKKLFDLMHEYPKSYTKKIHESNTITEDQCALVTRQQMIDFERIVDKLFKQFGIDFNFTKHFRDRMGDDRNNPCINMKELANLIKKIYVKQGKSIKDTKGAEAVIKDVQSNLNIPIAVNYDSKNDEFDVVMKTVMRKKDFKSPDKTIRY
jgi:hypothetical protein